MEEKILQILKKASSEIVKIYSQASCEVSEKADASPLTEADMRSHELVVSGLKAAFSYPILSEEGVVEFEERKRWESFWLLDPLDGTKEFLSKNGEFTINLALIHKGAPVFGAIAIPTQDLFYVAEKNRGAFKIAGKIREKIAHSRKGRDLICLESRSHSSPQVQEFCRENEIHRIEQYGSSLKFCRIAEGLADVYPRFGPTMEWDTGAAQVVLEEAGGKVVRLADGKALNYNKEDLTNPSFLASEQFFFWPKRIS